MSTVVAVIALVAGLALLLWSTIELSYFNRDRKLKWLQPVYTRGVVVPRHYWPLWFAGAALLVVGALSLRDWLGPWVYPMYPLGLYLGAALPVAFHNRRRAAANSG